MAIRHQLKTTKHLKPLLSSSLTHSLTLSSLHQPPQQQQQDLVNEISRILSDYRGPHHDLETPLGPYIESINTDIVEQVLKRCKNLGFSAHRFLLWAKRVPGFEPSVDSHHILTDILCSSRNFALLWDFLIELRECEGFEFRHELFWIVFRGYCRADLPHDAIRTFDRMIEFGLKPCVGDLDHLLYFLCKKKHAMIAHKFFDAVKNEFDVGVKTYSILINGCGDVRDLVLARKLFDEMLERGCEIDVVAYNSLLQTLCKGGSVNEAYTMFCELGLKGIAPNANSYAIFIRAYCEGNDIHSTIRVLDRMRRYDLVPNVFTYNCIIKRLCKNEKVDEAYQLLNEMIEKGAIPDTWSYNTILAYHCEHSEVNRATKLISRMVKDGCSPDRHTYNMIMKLLIRIGRFDTATEMWESMGERGFYASVSTYSVMVHGLCKKRGKLEEACKYFEMMIDEGIPPYSTTIQMVKNRLVGLGLMDNVELLARKMEQSTSCSIREMANAMRGNKACVQQRNEVSGDESE